MRNIEFASFVGAHVSHQSLLIGCCRKSKWNISSNDRSKLQVSQLGEPCWKDQCRPEWIPMLYRNGKNWLAKLAKLVKKICWDTSASKVCCWPLKSGLCDPVSKLIPSALFGQHDYVQPFQICGTGVCKTGQKSEPTIIRSWFSQKHLDSCFDSDLTPFGSQFWHRLDPFYLYLDIDSTLFCSRSWLKLNPVLVWILTWTQPSLGLSLDSDSTLFKSQSWLIFNSV